MEAENYIVSSRPGRKEGRERGRAGKEGREGKEGGPLKEDSVERKGNFHLLSLLSSESRLS